jgi:hypothetical protein
MSNLLSFVAVASFTAVFASSSAAAEFCKEIKDLGELRTFETYKGSWDSDLESYAATVRPVGSEGCSISEDMLRLRCRFRHADRSAPFEQQVTLTKQILACSGAQSQIIDEEVSPDRRLSLGGPTTQLRAIAGNRAIRFVVSAGGYKRKNSDQETWSTNLSVITK